MTEKDRPSPLQMTKLKPPRLAGFGPSSTEPDPEPPAQPEPKVATTEPETKPKTKAKAKAKPKAKPKAKAPAVIRTTTRLPHSLANRVRSAAQEQKGGRARLLLIAYLEHEDDLQQLLHPEQPKPRDEKHASVGLDLTVTEPTEIVTWELPPTGLERLDEACRQHGVTRTALIRALLETAYPEQPQP